MKKLTAKQIDERSVNKVLKRIRGLETIYHHDYIQSACYRYIQSNLQKKKALKDLEDAEKRLEEAKRRLNS